MMVRTERGLDRLVNFSDATVAIAITLLILPLVDAANEIKGVTFGVFFLEHVGLFIGFIITFFVIGQFWMVHHRIFEAVQGYSPALIRWNMLWLLSIVFLPFAANAVSNINGQEGSVYALYIGTMLVTCFAALMIDVVLIRHPELVMEDARGTISVMRGATLIAILVLALILAVLVPAVGMGWLLLLFVGPFIERLLRRLNRSAVRG